MERRKRSGFTLVEIMIVLAILVLLVAMVGPRLLKQQDKADKQLTIQAIDGIERSLQFYKVDNRGYPSTQEGIAALIRKPTDENRAKNWDGPYLEESDTPVDPWGNKYRYEFPPKFGSDKPNIWSAGPDGKDQTDDDIANWSNDAKPNESGGSGNEFEAASPNNATDEFAGQ